MCTGVHTGVQIHWAYVRVWVCVHVWVFSKQPGTWTPTCVAVCTCLCAHMSLHVGSWEVQGWQVSGSRRKSDRRDLPQPPAPGACFPACRSCEPVNSSYINSCCLLTYCREKRSWPWWGLSPPQGLGRRGGEKGPSPTLRPTPTGRQGSGPQPLPPPSQGAPTAQLILLGLSYWVGSGMGLDNWLRQRGWKAWLLPTPKNTDTQAYTHTCTHT